VWLAVRRAASLGNWQRSKQDPGCCSLQTGATLHTDSLRAVRPRQPQARGAPGEAGDSPAPGDSDTAASAAASDAGADAGARSCGDRAWAPLPGAAPAMPEGEWERVVDAAALPGDPLAFFRHVLCDEVRARARAALTAAAPLSVTA
jgi:hypothetical protein